MLNWCKKNSLHTLGCKRRYMDGRHDNLMSPNFRCKAFMPNFEQIWRLRKLNMRARDWLWVTYTIHVMSRTEGKKLTEINGFNKLKELEPSSVTLLIRVTTGVKGVDSRWTYRNGLCSFSLPGRASRTPSDTLKQIYTLYIYRVIHKSLRNFRTPLRNNQDIHGRKEHINR